MQEFLQQSISESGTILDRTLATCSTCLSITNAIILEREGKIFLEKNCCGKESVIIENDPEFYKKTILPYKFDYDFLEIGKRRQDPEIKKKLAHESSTLSFTVTLRCNMSCPICYEGSQAGKYGEKSDMKDEDVDKLLEGHKNKLICLSGGEPTLRMDLPAIIQKVVRSGNTPYIVTNGLRFLNKNYIKELKAAGLKHLSLQFDGFRKESYEKLRGGDFLKVKLKIIKNLMEEKMKIWLLPVIMRGENDDQIPEIIRFAANLNKSIIGLDFAPLYGGKNQSDIYTNSDILKTIEANCGIEVENYSESKRLRYNIYRLVGKYFGKNVGQNFKYLIRTPIFIKIKSKTIEPLIKTKDLKKMNDALEEIINKKSKVKSVLSLIKNLPAFFSKEIFGLAALSLFNGFNFPAASHSSSGKILKISSTRVSTSANEDLYRKGVIEDFTTLPNINYCREC